MPDWIIALILGIVEGITEFLPISSTGHLLITEKLLGTHQTDLFNVVIQCGAVLAVLPLFPERIHKFIFELAKPETRDYLIKVLIAFAITGAGGLVLDKLKVKLPEELTPVAWALLVGGIAFLVVEFLMRGKKSGTDITWAIVLAVGAGQRI